MLIEYIDFKHLCPNTKCNKIVAITQNDYDGEETTKKCPFCGKTNPISAYMRHKIKKINEYTYVFTNRGDGRAVALVKKEEHQDYFLSQPAMYRIADPQTITIPQKDKNYTTEKYGVGYLNILKSDDVLALAAREFGMNLEPRPTKKQAMDFILEKQAQKEQNVKDAVKLADTVSG